MDLIIPILPVVTKDLPISPRFTPYDFLSRCKFSTLTTRQPMVEYYLLTFPRFPLRKKEHKSYFGKNRTHDIRTSRSAGYLLDHSGDMGFIGVRLSTKENDFVSLGYGTYFIVYNTIQCVCVCFLPIHSGHQVRWTYQPESHRRKVTQDFSSTFFLRCAP